MTDTQKNGKLNDWVRQVADLCKPDSVYWCNGSKAEYDHLMAQMVTSGMAIALKQRPNCFLFRSEPSDVARTEERTYIASPTKVEAGPPIIGLTPTSSSEP